MSELISIGKICNDLNQPFQAVRMAAKRSGVKPSTSIDGVLYFDATDLAKIDQALRDGQQTAQQGAAR